MIHGYIIVFFLLAGLFTMTHLIAVQVSLYWYYWWFDSVMHLWGGMLIGLGVYALATLPTFQFKPTLKLVLLILSIVIVSWELFEWHYGVWGNGNYLFDTTKDIILGYSGGLLTHIFLQHRIK